MNQVYVFVAVMITTLALDAAWLTFRSSYHSALFKSIQGSAMVPRLLPGALVYLLIPAAILYFVLGRAKSVWDAAKDGAALGVAMYGLYDLTNYATLKGWTLTMTATDTLWGAYVCAVGAAAGKYVAGL
jgi:uncharacterized membrane protein